VTGRVHAQNALAAALAVRAIGYRPDAIHRGLREFTGVPGRFEVIGLDPPVAVDYAHTPDGLAGTLTTARELTAGRVICVFGCGGERDRGKRPQMAAIAERLADAIVVTDDNPRGEDANAIVAEIVAGLARPERAAIERDRAQAITRAIASARAGDCVLVAGKGHELYQEIGGRKLPFDDMAFARAALEERT
jgi:UDP-N-acetylmuramoyl-L-alanyl-D-glutamate--2,6-diaminopimelate ligase